MESGQGISSPELQLEPVSLNEEPHLSSPLYVFGNIIIAIIGSGVLGLPFAFMQVGWAAGILLLIVAGVLNYQGMVLLVKSRQLLNQHADEDRASRVNEDYEGTDLLEADDTPQEIHTYGDLASRILGPRGRMFVDIILVFTQAGFCIAYLIFIGENLSSVFTGGTSRRTLFIALFIPLEIVVSWLKSLTQLAPLSLLADALKFSALAAIVFHESFEVVKGGSVVLAFTSIRNIPSFVSTAVYAYEGAGMTLPLESSMKDRTQFPLTLALAFVVITCVYGGFGVMGYAAYGVNTCDVITLNLPSGSLTVIVKIAICAALSFTFPVMMYPVYEVYESYILLSKWYKDVVRFSPRLQKFGFPALRSLVVIAVAIVAAAVPEFSQVLTFVGSSLCSLLAFIFPAVLHLKTSGSSIGYVDKWVDYFLIAFGSVFGVWGTYDSIFS